MKLNVPVCVVIVIGGGPAGCATTLSLLKHSGSLNSLRVLLIDDTDNPAYKVRSTVLSRDVLLIELPCSR